MTQKILAAELGIGDSTLRKIKKDEAAIRDQALKGQGEKSSTG